MGASVTIPSTKPYLIRAIFEWCAESGLTPYLSVKVDQNTRVPLEYVKNGEIVLNVSMSATRNLTINNDLVQFSARFNGVSREVSVPIYAVSGIFSRENGQGLFFQPDMAPSLDAETDAAGSNVDMAGDGVDPPQEGQPDPGLALPTRPQSGKGRLKLVK